MSKQLRIRVIGLLVVLLSGLAAVGMIVPACGFNAPNLREVPSDGAEIPDSPPDAFVPDAAPCSSLIKTCVTEDLLRECQQVATLPKETPCDWGCTEPVPGNGRCRTFTPSGGAVTVQDLDRTMAMAAGLQKRTFTSILSAGTINTDNGSIQIGGDTRGMGTGVINGVDFKVVNGVGIFRFMEVEFKGFQAIRVVGSNALAIVGIDRITVSDGTQFDMRGNCTGRNAGPGGKLGGMPNTNGSGNGAGGAGDNTGVCSGGGGAGNSRTGGNGGGRANAGGTTGNATITVLTGGAGGGGGGGGGDGGGGGGAVQFVSNGQVKFDAGTLSQVGINAGGCGGKGGSCGGGAGAGGAILIEGRTVDLNDAFFTVNGGGGGGAANGASGEMAQTVARANGGGGAIGPGSNDDGGDGGGGGDDGSMASPGGVRDQRGGGGGGGVGWIRIQTRSGSVGGGAFFSPSNPSASASTGMANVQ